MVLFVIGFVRVWVLIDPDDPYFLKDGRFLFGLTKRVFSEGVEVDNGDGLDLDLEEGLDCGREGMLRPGCLGGVLMVCESSYSSSQRRSSVCDAVQGLQRFQEARNRVKTVRYPHIPD